MAWVPRDEEITSVLLLDDPNRYRYCVKKAADEEQLWSLWQESGWALAGDDAGREVVPVWPHERFASMCANGLWAGCQPKAIDIRAWLGCWIPGMEKDARLVAVFPTPQRKGAVVEPRRFEADLREETIAIRVTRREKASGKAPVKTGKE